MSDYEDSWQSREQTLARLRDGYDLFVIKSGEARVHYAWAEYRRFLIPPLDQWVELPPACAHVAGVYTKPAFRNKGLAKYNYAVMLRHFKAAGLRQVCLSIDPSNAPSIRAACRMGFRDYLHVRYFRLVLLRCYLFTDGRRSRLFIKISKAPDDAFNRRLFPFPTTER